MGTKTIKHQTLLALITGPGVSPLMSEALSSGHELVVYNEELKDLRAGETIGTNIAVCDSYCPNWADDIRKGSRRPKKETTEL